MIPVAEAKPKPEYVASEPFLPIDELKTVGTQMHQFHEWYMKALADGKDTIGAKIRSMYYFTCQDDYVWIPFKDVFDLYQLDALDVSDHRVDHEKWRYKGPSKIKMTILHSWTLGKLTRSWCKPKSIVSRTVLSISWRKTILGNEFFFRTKKVSYISSHAIYNYHWILFAFNVSYSTVLVFDSMDKNEAWDRFRKLISGNFKEKLERIYKLRVDKHKIGTNLCGYFVCDYLHNLTPSQGRQEPLMGFINEQILDPAGEFYVDD
uniref:Ubiquitin-like protease family profile domain-containing protein n=1 Tax=Leersia perrieri TaxID=77586 RepID=A0A0D9WID8_9ORYZ